MLFPLLLWQSTRCQAPSSSWRPNFSPLGGPGQSLYCWKDAQNPNLPHTHDHIGSCGCENTQFRWMDSDGRTALYMMESHAHGCDTPPHAWASLQYCSEEWARTTHLTSVSRNAQSD